jgi:hypothetical protein
MNIPLRQYLRKRAANKLAHPQLSLCGACPVLKTVLSHKPPLTSQQGFAKRPWLRYEQTQKNL